MNIDEMMRSYSDSLRLSIAVEEMKKFLQGSGIEDQEIRDACSDPLVLEVFVLTHLFEIDLCDELGKWMLTAGKWQRVERWKTLSDRWERRWEKPRRRESEQGNFMAVWRLACMVEGWRLLDSFYLQGGRDNRHLIPSVEEISTAAMEWLDNRGVKRKSMENIRSKDKREFTKIALEWILRAGLKKPPEVLDLDTTEPQIVIHGPSELLDVIEAEVAEYEAWHGDAPEMELNALRSLDWPE